MEQSAEVHFGLSRLVPERRDVLAGIELAPAPRRLLLTWEQGSRARLERPARNVRRSARVSDRGAPNLAAREYSSVAASSVGTILTGSA